MFHSSGVFAVPAGLPSNSGHFVEYILDRRDVSSPWQEFTYHDFVRQMGDGTLPMEKFQHYMIQDYLYLVRPCTRESLA